MVTLLTLTDAVSDDYLAFLKNWLCFTAHYEHKPLIYVVAPDWGQPRVRHVVHALQTHNPRSRYIDFPDALFWRLLSAKTNFAGHYGVKWRLDFRGSVPAHAHFGAPLLKVVQMLEIVRQGYDVMYFDVDVAFVKDPVQMMTLGDSTVAVSVESRTCATMTFAEPTVKEVQPARVTEPNSGIILVRAQRDPANATAPGRGAAFMEYYAAVMVNEHTTNDQFQLRTKHRGWYDVTTDCHVRYTQAFTLGTDCKNEDGGGGGGGGGGYPRQPRPRDPSPPRRVPSLCYLPDILFENGMFAFRCVRHSENTLRLNRLGRVGSAKGVTTPPDGSLAANASLRSLLTPLATLNVTGSVPAGADNDDFIAPVTAHANFCPGKAQCLAEAGFWLVAGNDPNHNHNQSVCRPYDIRRTFFRQLQWYQQLARVENETLALIRLYPPGTILKFRRSSAVYFVDAGPVLRLLPPGAQALLGLEVNQDVAIPDPWESNILREFMVVGDPMPALNSSLFPACRVKRTNVTAAATAITTTTTAATATSSGANNGWTTTLPTLLALWKRGQLRTLSDCPALEERKHT